MTAAADHVLGQMQDEQPRTGLILGSGLNDLAEAI